MNEEEKQAIEWLKKAEWFSARLYSPTILNLIEKQQKEIEELKELNKKLDAQIDLEWVENNYIEKSKYNQLLKVIDKLLEEEAVNVMYYDTEEDRQEYIKQLKEKLYKEVENE